MTPFIYTNERDRIIILEKINTEGFVIISLNTWNEKDRPDVIKSILELNFVQIKVFSKIDLWRSIGVDLDKKIDRSEGIGESPLHMDFVNASIPPDLVTLICIRNDIYGGGQSTFSPIDDSFFALPMEDQVELQKNIFSNGDFYDLENIGSGLIKFPVYSSASRYRFRYTDQFLNLPLHEKTKASLLRIHIELKKREQIYLLKPGEVIIFNQKKYVHGKLPLGNGQINIPTHERRLLLHGFFRQL